MAEHDHAEEYDPAVVWYPHRVVNHRDMAQAWARREYEEAHHEKQWHDGTFTSWAAKRSESHAHHADDGVRYVVTREKPETDEWF